MNELERLIAKNKIRHFIGLKRNPKTRKNKNSEITINIIFPRYDKAEPIDERILPISEICCSHFGCPIILSMTEKLFGNKCIEHQFKKKLYFHNGKL